MNKKRYIPIVAIGALILSLIVVFPAFGADEVEFIVPGDVTTPTADGLVTLSDDTPDEQTYGRQGGQIGLFVDDDSLDKPIRRVIIPVVDTEYVDTPNASTTLTGHIRTTNVDAHSAKLTVTRGFLKRNDYILLSNDPGDAGTGGGLVADGTLVRKVKDVGAPKPEPSSVSADGATVTWRVPAKDNPNKTADTGDHDSFVLEHGRVAGLTVALDNLTTAEDLANLQKAVTTLKVTTPLDTTANSAADSELKFTLGSKATARFIDPDGDGTGTVVVDATITGTRDAVAANGGAAAPAVSSIVIQYDLDGPTQGQVGTGNPVSTTLNIIPYDVATSQEAVVVTLDRPFTKDMTGQKVYRIQDGRSRTGDEAVRYVQESGAPLETAASGSEVNVPKLAGTAWSSNYMHYAFATTKIADSSGSRPYLVARSRMASSLASTVDDTNTVPIPTTGDVTFVKQRFGGGGVGRVRTNDDALSVNVDSDGDGIEGLFRVNDIDQDTVVTSQSAANDIYTLAWWIEPNELAATVRSKAHTSAVTLMLQETDEESGKFVLRIGTTNPEDKGGDEPNLNLNPKGTAANINKGIPTIPVNPDDVLTLTATGSSASLPIETTGSAYTGLSPENGSADTSDRPRITAQITDGDSGVNKSKIRILFLIEEGGNESYVSIDPNEDGDVDDISGGVEIEGRLVGTQAPDGDATIHWWIGSQDKAGNVSYSDRVRNVSDTGDPDPCEVSDGPTNVSDDPTSAVAGADLTVQELIDKLNAEDSGCDPYVVFVDRTAPKLLRAETGRSWMPSLTTGKSADKTEYRVNKADPSSVLVVFDGYLDISSVSANDFEVSGSAPVDAAAYNVSLRAGISTDVKNYDGYTAGDQVIDISGTKRGYVFLRLASDLKASAEPKVELVGEVLDIAGNEQDSGTDNDALDRIAPTLTVTIDEGSRPSTRDKVNLRITADENIGSPTVTFNEVISYGTKDEDTKVDPDGAKGTGAVKFVSSDEYTAVISAASAVDGLYTVRVTATDSTGGNLGATGDNDEKVDVSDDTKAILFERDRNLGKPDVDPDTPGIDDSFAIDDPNASIFIDYSAEAYEYDKQTHDHDGDSATEEIKGNDLDTHGGVTIVSAMLGDMDITDQLQANDAGNIFLYKASDLALGKHTLAVVAMDAAGNKHPVAEETTIEIIERKPFSLKLNPGWNLVSIPGEPQDPDINAIIPADRTDISSVLAYDPTVPGLWLSATRGADGMFSGTLDTIVATRGYWIETTTFNPLPVMIPKQSPGQARLLPTIPVSKGWNMIPVLDVDGNFKLEDGNDDRKDDDTLPTFSTLKSETVDDDKEARGYLDGLDEGSTRAYTFNTLTNRWNLVSEVQLGKGYWVYVSKAGIIVP